MTSTGHKIDGGSWDERLEALKALLADDEIAADKCEVLGDFLANEFFPCDPTEGFRLTWLDDLPYVTSLLLLPGRVEDVVGEWGKGPEVRREVWERLRDKGLNREECSRVTGTALLLAFDLEMKAIEDGIGADLLVHLSDSFRTLRELLTEYNRWHVPMRTRQGICKIRVKYWNAMRTLLAACDKPRVALADNLRRNLRCVDDAEDAFFAFECNPEDPLAAAEHIRYFRHRNLSGHSFPLDYKYWKDWDLWKEMTDLALDVRRTLPGLPSIPNPEEEMEDGRKGGWNDLVQLEEWFIKASELRQRCAPVATPQGRDEGSLKAIDQPVGRRRQYSDELCQRAQGEYDELRAKGEDSKRAWSTVAEHQGFPNGDAARGACYRYQKRRRSAN